MNYTRRDGIYSPEFRKGSKARGTSQANRSHLTPADPISPYVYGGSKLSSRPEAPADERPDQPSPKMQEITREAAVHRSLTVHPERRVKSDPLSKAELKPGMWVELRNNSCAKPYTQLGFLAIDRQEFRRLLMWQLHPSGARPHCILGPDDDRSGMPVHDMVVVDHRCLTVQERITLVTFAFQAVWCPKVTEFVIPEESSPPPRKRTKSGKIRVQIK
ncbi:hypothetical protein [Streptomyces malaysiensis]|uniref:Uncharacterized protein n=1 Tax=Streptomyces malaysiensis TaxID=92644 RepID=A0A7X6AZS5_STRMQ|nr:hypothetical protein [Streptomyces malaysiensis]NIY68090.1 hypothetical protein [Streptomyces malaysiensis]